MKKILFAVIALFLAAPAQAQQVPSSPQQMQLSFAPLVKKAGPAVVNIYTKRVVKERARVVSPFMNDPFFSQFFGGQEFAGPMKEKVERSLGSGVILDESGTIATNHHVVGDADEITVITSDGREFAAKRQLDDARVDLAILKIDPKGEKLPFLELADSDAAQVGDLVLAIGDPFGVGQTVTSGIVSGLARTGTGIADYGFFIQTDAAINPGNSGGALIDMSGKLIGVNTAIVSASGGSVGIGFAIPANMLKSMITAAAHGGKVVHPWSGIASQNVTPDMVESLKLKRAYGTLVAKVTPGGPADKAGLQSGDVILSLDGRELQDAAALRFRLATVPLGTAVKMIVWRGGKEIPLTMVTAAPPETPPRDETKLSGQNPLSGAVVVNISPAVLEEMGQLGQDKGVVLSEVQDGAAARLGFQKGDILVGVNGKKIGSVEDLKDALKARPRGWQLEFMRGGRQMSLVIQG
jgi:serine protease Do